MPSAEELARARTRADFLGEELRLLLCRGATALIGLLKADNLVINALDPS